MTRNSKIEWTDHTFNPWVGCTKISPGCDHCYAEAWAKRSGMVEWGGLRRQTSPGNWRQPLKWNEAAREAGRRDRVFCASLADVFDNEVPSGWRYELFSLIAKTRHLDWLLLTKRIGNAQRMLFELDRFWDVAPWSNVWIGATVVNQEEADRDVPKLLATRATVRFLSCEPLLGPIDLPGLFFYGTEESGGVVPLRDRGYNQIDWVIAGGESGPHARPMHPDWARSLRDQCIAARVPFHFKQWGEFLPRTANIDDPEIADVPDSRLYWSDGQPYWPQDGQRGGVDLVARVGKARAGRQLDGRTWDEFPVAA